MLSKGLPARKRTWKASSESLRKARVDIPISVAPVSVMGIPKIYPKVEIPPTIESKPIIDVVEPSMLLSPPTKIQVLEPPLGRKKEVWKKRTRRTIRKSQRKVHHNGPNSSDEKMGENPFNNHEVIWGLVDGFTIPKVVDRIVDIDVDQQAWDSLRSFFKTGYQLLGYIRSLNHLRLELEKACKDHQVEVEHLFKE
ncbi:putative ensconsin-like [Cocos nucifera]|uniref:Putative ensconsin-like n=1 Tax=Cocos nucifera TaxID=13894 RepID=A0A8K0ITL7_COCNU|nr:putative ensconsin-like [Cocos nucifera]